jgi:hypothetical protein
MLVHIPDHLSSNFLFDFSKCPCSKTDRQSMLKAILRIILGLGLFTLGCFELLSFLSTQKQNEESFISVEIFAIIIIALALLIIISSFSSLMKYKKFHFDGDKFDIKYKPSFGSAYFVSAPLKEYSGVRLRILLAQNSIFKKHRYIIDLYHNDNNKIIPLYISTSKDDLIKIWHSYAKALGLPTINTSERGIVKRECNDLDKNLRELSNEDKLPFIASGKLPAPKSFNITENKLSTLVKTINGNLFFHNHYDISCKNISLRYYFGKSLLRDENINIDDIKNIELTYNFITGKYGIAIITDKEIHLIKDKLPVNDLLWLKDFIVRKIVGN